jgi:RNA polymerase sigma-70 factor (ECF subfamily)
MLVWFVVKQLHFILRKSPSKSDIGIFFFKLFTVGHGLSGLLFLSFQKLSLIARSIHVMEPSEKNIDVTDEELIKRFIRFRDESAIEEIITRYRGAALKYACCILKDRMLAEDAVQEAFVRVVTRYDQYDFRRPFCGWFYTILRHICIDIYRKEIKRNKSEESVSSSSMLELSDKPQDRTAELLECLGGADREILTLRFIHGMRFEEIAEYFSISIDAAKKRAERALVRLKNLLDQENKI